MANDAFKKELHMMCHWFGTHGSLRLFSIYTPVLINTLYPDPKVPVMSDDFVTRNDTFPAGTARATIVDAAVRKTKTSPLWAACPGLPIIGESVTWVTNTRALVAAFRNAARVAGANIPYVPRTNGNPLSPAEAFTRDQTQIDPRVKYHIGADFLAGRAGVREALTPNDGTGLIGPIFFYTKKSSITASPHITRMEGGIARPAYEGSDSYDEAWDSAVKAYAAAQTPVSARILLKMSGANQTGIVEKAVYTNFMVSLGYSANDAGSHYEDIAAATISDAEEEEGGPNEY
jgi:hypothetical protein